MISNFKPSPVEQLRQMLRHFRRVVPVGEDVEQVRGGGKIEPFEKKSKDEGDEDMSDKRQNISNQPWESKSLCLEIFRQRLLALRQALHQLQQLLWKSLGVGRLHHVRRLGHLHHQHLEVFVHNVKPAGIFRKLCSDILRPNED